MSLRVSRLRPGAQLPVRATDGSVGYDIFMDQDFPPFILAPGEQQKIPTGLAIQVDVLGYYGQIIGRSGLAARGIQVMLGGVIDSDYRGEMFILLRNFSNEPFKVEGRIAQLVLLRYATLLVEEVAFSELSQTERGASGFGSTGMGDLPR